VDDCRAETQSLLRELNQSTLLPGEQDILAMVRAAAVGLDIAPPTGTGLRIYVRLLRDVPRLVLQAATEELIRTYTYPSFPKPANWLDLVQEDQKLIAKAKLMMLVYENRLKIAHLRYGRR